MQPSEIYAAAKIETLTQRESKSTLLITPGYCVLVQIEADRWTPSPTWSQFSHCISIEKIQAAAASSV